MRSRRDLLLYLDETHSFGPPVLEFHGWAALGSGATFDLDAAGFAFDPAERYLIWIFAQMPSGLSLDVPRLNSSTGLQWLDNDGTASFPNTIANTLDHLSETPPIFGQQFGLAMATGDAVELVFGSPDPGILEVLVWHIATPALDLFLRFDTDVLTDVPAAIDFPSLDVAEQYSKAERVAVIWPTSLGTGAGTPSMFPVDFGEGGSPDQGHIGAIDAGSSSIPWTVPADPAGLTFEFAATPGDGRVLATTFAVGFNAASSDPPGTTQTLKLPGFLRGHRFFGPRLVTPGTDQFFASELRTWLVRRDDLVNPVDEITGRKGATFQSQVNEAGSGKLELANEDPILDELQDDDLIRWERRGYGAFVSLAKVRTHRVIDPAEERGQKTTIEGPGHAALLGEGLVYPSRGVDVFPIEIDRVFNFASPYLDDSLWLPASEIVFNAANTEAFNPFWNGVPEHWPRGEAGEVNAAFGWWIFSQLGTPRFCPPGTCWFRKHVTTGAGVTNLMFLMACDNFGEVWLDGQLILSGGTESTPKDLFTAFIAIDPAGGDHLIAAKCVNSPEPPPIDGDANPGGILISVHEADPLGNWFSDRQVTSTDRSWLMADGVNAIAIPGMTPGRLVRRLVEEIQARGTLLDLVLMFDDEFDSDGNTWELVGEYATKVGNDLFTFLRELSATYLDFWMGPAGLELYLYRPDGLGDALDGNLHGPTNPTDPNSSNLKALVYRRET